jgi:hypothetical protein
MSTALAPVWLLLEHLRFAALSAGSAPTVSTQKVSDLARFPLFS